MTRAGDKIERLEGVVGGWMLSPTCFLRLLWAGRVLGAMYLVVSGSESGGGGLAALRCTQRDKFSSDPDTLSLIDSRIERTLPCW